MLSNMFPELRTFHDTLFVSVNVVDGEVLHITKVSRLHMGAYLCIASNGVPPSISKRVMLRVQCKLISLLYIILGSTDHQTKVLIVINKQYPLYQLKYCLTVSIFMIGF